MTSLQAQLRGMISDFTEGDEGAMSAALSAFETLTHSLDEYKKSQAPGAGSTALPTSTRATGYSNQSAPKLQPPPGGSGAQAPGQKPAEEAPLISFD